MDKILKQQKIFANKYLYENNKSKATSKPAAAITKDDEDFPGTAQVEALLNDIKARAIEMVNEQSPSVSNLIANTVTETSFDADPILKHVKVSSPGYTFDSLDNIDKRKANDPNVVMIPNKEDKHNISARSLKEDAFPIAENGEDRHDIMKKLKKVYKNVKNKVSKGYRKGVETAKSTVKCKTKKINHDVTKAMGKPKSLHVTKPSKVTQKPRNYDTAKTTKKMKKTQSQETTSASTIDDFALITMYEQILAKTYQDNAMKMPTTSNKIKFDKIISKRNPETLSDLSLKEDIKRIYDDGENIPEIDYGNDILPGSDDYLIDSNANSTNPPDSGISVNNEDPVKDTSYEGLSNKIHYNDYVNGYKNYLKFQKEQANTNFSNLVKYQAHRHHKVEDIGKYILDKIPQIPKINRKRFLDDMDMDEQDISTNSNDSWFKKHFYMFSDSQQKKYHTSETVKFKDSVIARKVDTTGSVDNMKPESNLVTEVGEEENTEHRVDLDELSRALENTRVGILEAEHDQQKKYHTSETDEFKDLVFAGKVDTTGSVDIMKPESNLVTEVGEEENTEHNLDELSRALENTRVAILEAEPELNNIEIPEPVKDSIKERRNSIKEKYSLIDFKNSGNDDVNTDNRFRRNAKITKQDNEIPKQTTLMYKNDITKPHKKDGFVSLVTRPTAIVNLHKTNVKESKIKKLLNKLHFHRCNRKKLKEKRHCSRVQRFNPLKKIKNMFSPKPLRVESKAGDDYELMASHIETFKPVKYEKIPNMNELKSQVPNISGEELIDEAMVTEPKNEVGFEVTTKMFPELDGYTNAETMNYGAISTTPFPTTPEFLSHTRFNARTDEHGSNEDIAENDDIIKVKIKEQSITLDNNIINQSTDDLKYSVPTSYQYKIQDKNYEILNNTDEKQLDDDIKAKFISTAEQISYITDKHIAETVNPVADKIKPYNYVDDYNYQYKETYPNQKLGKIKQYFQEYTKNKSTRPYEEFTSNQLFSNDLRSSNVFTNDKTYPDYFNDLIVWNHDILNYYDKGSISTSTQFTTPDLKDMEKQLYEMGTMNSTDNGDSDNEVISISPDSVREYFTDTMKVDVDNNEMGNLDVKSSQGDQVNHIVIPTKEPKEISFFNFRDSKEVSNKFYTSPHGLSDRGRTSRATGRLSKGVKNSIKTSTRKLAVPITKMNKQPEQFYDTPVAMKNDQFEKFLKDNQLDVGTVTIPMPPLPEISETGTLGSQINILTKNTKLTNKGTSPKNVTVKKVVKPVTKRSRDDINELVNNAYPEKQIKYLKDLEEDNFNDYADINNKQKRPRADYNTFTDDGALFGNEKYDKIKDKLNSMVFNNKPHPASNSNQETITNPDNNQNDDLELTIIDFDDGKAANGDKFVTEPDLKALFKDSTKKSSDQNNAIAPRTQIKPMELGYKDKHGNLPQRVQISAHSYKYDVSFNVPQKANRESDISTITINEYFDNIKDLQWTRNSDIPRQFVKLKSSSTEKHQIIKVVEVVKAVDDYTRPDIEFHIDLPTYYDPYTKIDTKIVPYHVKSSWTELALKYIFGIALIEMLNKLGVLRDGLNFTEGLGFNFNEEKVFSSVGNNTRKARAERAVKTTKKPKTFSQSIHFTRVSKSPRIANLLQAIKQKLLGFPKNESAATQLIKTTTQLTTNTHKLVTHKVEATDKGKIPSKGSIKNTYNNEIKDVIYLDKINVYPLDDSNVLTTTEITYENKPINKEGVYRDDVKYKNEVHSKTNSESKALTKTINNEINIANISDVDTTLECNNNKLKRDINSKSFTAKDVAALEVILDLVKDNDNYGAIAPQYFMDRRYLELASSTRGRQVKPYYSCKNEGAVTNSIQVHIAIPRDMTNMKRSLDPIKTRKVFYAKMATPVDLEYQINSIDTSTETTSEINNDYDLPSGLYLLIDDENNGSRKCALKVIKNREMKNDVDIEDITKKYNMVTLSKEFVAAINKQLVKLLENMTIIDQEKNKNRIVKRENSWDKIKKIFGDERVCDCKCIVNKPMCKTCAACDKVIKELSFEFDNLSQYMSDHCTEIQTFFRMNPSGGKVLRDSVHKIDKSLNDYFKRVRNKCKGRPCKTFTTYMDKRDLVNKKASRDYIGEPLIDDMKSLHAKFDAMSHVIPYDQTLKEKGVQLVKAASNCISKSISKRSCNTSKRNKNNRHVYSLDNISVNIICNPEAPSSSISTIAMDYTEPPITFNKDTQNYGLHKRNNQNRLRNWYGKMFTYHVKNVTKPDHFKRDVKNGQVESPLIADTGGSFWHDYINKSNKVASNDNTPKTIQSSTKTGSLRDILKNIYAKKIKPTTSKVNPNMLTEDSLSNTETKTFDNHNKEDQNILADPTIIGRKNHTTKQKTKITKSRKNKLYKASKAKMHCKHKTTATEIVKDLPIDPYKTTIGVITNFTNTANLNDNTEATTGLFKQTKMATFGVLDVFSKESQTNYTEAGDSHTTEPDNSVESKRIFAKNVISEPTTETNPTIIIIDEDNTKADTTEESKSNQYKSIILSFINYEINKLDKEKQHLYEDMFEERKINDAGVINLNDAYDFMPVQKSMVQPTIKTITVDQDANYDLLKSLKSIDLEIEAPNKRGSGLLDKIVKTFKVKFIPVKAAPINQDFTTSDDAVTKIHSLKPQTNYYVTKKDIYAKEKDDKYRRRNKGRISDPHNNTINNIKRNKYYLERKLKRAEFDSFVKGENGIYRLKRIKNAKRYRRKFNQDIDKRKYVITQRKYKRSFSDGIQNSSKWMLHTTAGRFVIAITCVYVNFAVLAAVVHYWASRR